MCVCDDGVNVGDCLEIEIWRRLHCPRLNKKETSAKSTIENVYTKVNKLQCDRYVDDSHNHKGSKITNNGHDNGGRSSGRDQPRGFPSRWFQATGAMGQHTTYSYPQVELNHLSKYDLIVNRFGVVIKLSWVSSPAVS